jgi:hypothetical protein
MGRMGRMAWNGLVLKYHTLRLGRAAGCSVGLWPSGALPASGDPPGYDTAPAHQSSHKNATVTDPAITRTPGLPDALQLTRRAESSLKSSTVTPAMKPEASSTHTSADGKSGLGFPEVSQESTRLMEDRPPPSFAEQIAHARMLLSWKKGRPSDHPPRQGARFEM